MSEETPDPRRHINERSLCRDCHHSLVIVTTLAQNYNQSKFATHKHCHFASESGARVMSDVVLECSMFTPIVKDPPALEDTEE